MTFRSNEAASNPLLLEGDSIRTWDGSASLEWLATNGIGGYASGTLSGANTRRYHALLMAALAPPLGRTLLVSRLEETMALDGQTYSLASNQWWDESVSPRGFENLDSFRLEEGLPVFCYRIGAHLLEKRVWMEDAENLTWVQYSLRGPDAIASLNLKLFTGYRDFHWSQHSSSDWHWRTGLLSDGVWVSPGDPSVKIVARSAPFTRFVPENSWYYGFLHGVERRRGLDDVEDLWAPGSLELPITTSAPVSLLLSAGETKRSPAEGIAALSRERQRRRSLLGKVRMPLECPEEIALAAAADAFLVRRPFDQAALPEKANTILAGYHWFGDWGRDTMISLPGLAISTGRYEEARDILVSYSEFVSDGDASEPVSGLGAAPEYNTVDATLWYLQAVHRYLQASNDRPTLQHLFPCLASIIEFHLKGTRHGIQVDPSDGLLHAGVPGLQLTWMDARVGDWVVTPRIGKPVEIAALWLNALRLMAGWAPGCRTEGSRYQSAAEQAEKSFNPRYWIEEGGYLYDVIDGPDGDDGSFRPNQLLALSLPYPLVSRERAQRIVDACERKLLTPCGLRSLDPADHRYVGSYGGNQTSRDGAYHQGTVWGWLIGPYADAVLYAYGNRDRAMAAVRPLLEQVRTAGVGTISEIFTGDAPFEARGCIAQAWSVGEVLRVLSS